MKKNIIKNVELIYGINDSTMSINLSQKMIDKMEIKGIKRCENITAEGVMFTYYKCEHLLIAVLREKIDYELERKLETHLNISSIKVEFDNGVVRNYQLPTMPFSYEEDERMYEFNCLLGIDYKPKNGKEIGTLCIKVGVEDDK